MTMTGASTSDGSTGTDATTPTSTTSTTTATTAITDTTDTSTGATSGVPSTGATTGGPLCGDGVVDDGEACDDGNTTNDDACVACQDAVCGDSHVQVGVEECDDGNPANDDECTELCAPPSCADGLASGAETDVDCGGATCSKCAAGLLCAAASDCESAFCDAGVCAIAASCAAILAADPAAPSGAYSLDLDGDGPAEPFRAYCDQTTDGGGWMMVFKVSSGVMGDALTLWNGGPMNEADESLLNVEKADKHYVGAFVGSYWNQNQVEVSQARVHVYTAGEIAKFWKYDATGTTLTDWYSNDTLVESSYVDLPAMVFNQYSIAGEITSGRRFFINRNYNNCPGDQGWLNVDTGPDKCMWDTNGGAVPIRIMYAPGDTYINWTTAVQNKTIGVGDAFAVFVR